MYDILAAVLNPKDLSDVKLALGGNIIGWTYEMIRDIENFDTIIGKFCDLRKILFDSGFAEFFQMLLDSVWHTDNKNIQERMLLGGVSIDFYSELHQVAHLLIEHRCSPDSLLSFIDNFTKFSR